MPGTTPISAVIITRDGARHLDRVLASVAFCADIVVLDSGSTDETCAIAAAHGARISHQNFLGFGPQKQAAVALARYDWILSIDADEMLTEEAQKEISALINATPDPTACFAIRRRTFIGTREIHYGDWNPDWSLRLFHRQHAQFSDDMVHESVQAARPPIRLQATMLHYSFVDLADIFKTGYARTKAQRYLASGRHAGSLTILFRFVLTFLRGYVLKRGFLDGVPGILVALSSGLNAILGLALADAQRRGECGQNAPSSDPRR